MMKGREYGHLLFVLHICNSHKTNALSHPNIADRISSPIIFIPSDIPTSIAAALMERLRSLASRTLASFSSSSLRDQCVMTYDVVDGHASNDRGDSLVKGFFDVFFCNATLEKHTHCVKLTRRRLTRCQRAPSSRSTDRFCHFGCKNPPRIDHRGDSLVKGFFDVFFCNATLEKLTHCVKLTRRRLTRCQRAPSSRPTDRFCHFGCKNPPRIDHRGGV